MIQTKLPTNTSVIAIWDEFIQMRENPAYRTPEGMYEAENDPEKQLREWAKRKLQGLENT
ncbi:MAG: hypothetical protein AB4080_18510 [Trichodesmium sp.]